uniref:SLAM family member 9 n=1 Tax=Euleptes europaea TaxID=460621 RepID=UPI00254163DD|nr:SLAM family member 9 [Euleptes europaea]
MDAFSRFSPVLFALVLQAARTGSVEGAARQDLIRQVGETATFPLEVPEAFNISNLIWRSSSRGPMQAVASWAPESTINVLGTNYVRRVTFLEESWTLEIHNLSKADGGYYVVVEPQDDSDITLQEYLLVVFDITVKESSSANGSCSLSLRCEAGSGAWTQVKYSWSPRGPEDQGSTLNLTLHPDDKKTQYTCTATALGTQHSVSITPYKHCPASSRAAGLRAPASIAQAACGLALLLLLLPPLL